MAVELKEPALQLMTFIENNREPALADRFIGDLISRPLAEIAADALRRRGRWARCSAQHRANIDVDPRGGEAGAAAWSSSTSPTSNIGAFNKFIAYYLFPEARYSVGLTLGWPRQDLRRLEPLVARCRAPTTSARSASATAAAATRSSARSRCRATRWRARARLAEIVAELQGPGKAP